MPPLALAPARILSPDLYLRLCGSTLPEVLMPVPLPSLLHRLTSKQDRIGASPMGHLWHSPALHRHASLPPTPPFGDLFNPEKGLPGGSVGRGRRGGIHRLQFQTLVLGPVPWQARKCPTQRGSARPASVQVHCLPNQPPALTTTPGPHYTARAALHSTAKRLRHASCYRSFRKSQGQGLPGRFWSC